MGTMRSWSLIAWPCAVVEKVICVASLNPTAENLLSFFMTNQCIMMYMTACYSNIAVTQVLGEYFCQYYVIVLQEVRVEVWMWYTLSEMITLFTCFHSWKAVPYVWFSCWHPGCWDACRCVTSSGPDINYPCERLSLLSVCCVCV